MNEVALSDHSNFFPLIDNLKVAHAVACIHVLQLREESPVA